MGKVYHEPGSLCHSAVRLVLDSLTKANALTLLVRNWGLGRADALLEVIQ